MKIKKRKKDEEFDITDLKANEKFKFFNEQALQIKDFNRKETNRLSKTRKRSPSKPKKSRNKSLIGHSTTQ